MKLYPAISAMILACILFTACPYEAPVPIDSPTVKINDALLGNWTEDKNKDAYHVSKQDEFTYRIEQTKNGNESKDTLYAFMSMVNGTKFLNIWQNDKDESIKKYSFYKIEILPDGTIRLAEVTENIEEKFSWSADLKKFILENMSHSYFFGKEKIILTRIKK